MKVPAAFHKVSPFWARTMSAAKTIKTLPGYKYVDGRGQAHQVQSEDGMHNLGDGGSCAVGEAHGMTARYWDGHILEEQCDDCSFYSQTFYGILCGSHDHEGNRKGQLSMLVLDFTEHWKAKHDPLIGVIPEIEPVEILADQIKAKQ